jgi:hypothetical protein
VFALPVVLETKNVVKTYKLNNSKNNKNLYLYKPTACYSHYVILIMLFSFVQFPFIK